MGDTFYPDNLRMKQPLLSGLDTKRNVLKGELDSLSFTYTSFLSPAPVMSPSTDDRRIKTRVLPKRSIIGDSSILEQYQSTSSPSQFKK
jgi:hypothetical protein